MSLCAMYAAIYICGISTNHLTFSDRVHPVITSLIRYHVYFWVRRFRGTRVCLPEYRYISDYRYRGHIVIPVHKEELNILYSIWIVNERGTTSTFNANTPPRTPEPVTSAG